MWLLTMRTSASLTLVPSLGTLYLLLGWLLYLLHVLCLFCHTGLLSLRNLFFFCSCQIFFIKLFPFVCSFLGRDRNGVDPKRRWGGEELGRVERRETIVRIYCIELSVQVHSHTWTVFPIIGLGIPKYQVSLEFFLYDVQHCKAVDLGPSFVPAEIHIYYMLLVSNIYTSSDFNSIHILFLSSDFSLKILKSPDHI